MVRRARALDEVSRLLARNRVVAILGARQVGKTTLAAQLAAQWRKGPVTRFDLEDPRHLAMLDEASLTLRGLKGLVILDEIQRRPDLFPLLRVLADRKRPATRFLILGSASPELLRQSSESLAGRIQYLELHGFNLGEVGPKRLDRLWLRGGFPRSYLARSDAESAEWRRGFVRTFLERDLPQLGVRVPAPTIRRFWTMLAHYHAQVWNASEFGRTFGVGDTTVRRYLDLLTATFVVRQLSPWHANLKKRQVKSPKLYFRDSGLLHSMLQLDSRRDLLNHPRLGASWEGFALDAVLSRSGARPQECYFWATHAGAELDLLLVRGRRKLGFEFKRTDSPRRAPSMRTAMTDLGLTHLYVIHAGDRTFALDRKITAVPLVRLLDDVPKLS